jgi:hypothetical protein
VDYHVYGRLSSAVRGPFALHLDLVTSDPTRPDQTTRRIGAFTQQTGTGGWQTYDYIPLRDQHGNLALVRLEGETTLRVTSTAAPFAANFFILVPAHE